MTCVKMTNTHYDCRTSMFHLDVTLDGARVTIVVVGTIMSFKGTLTGGNLITLDNGFQFKKQELGNK